MRQVPGGPARRLRGLRLLAAFAAAVTVLGLLAAGGPAPAALASGPSGLSQANLQTAYGFQSATEGMGETVAVITAYDDPDAESDLDSYRSQYGLALCSSGGCFRKVNEYGGTTFPAAGWSAGTAQSLDAVSAVCPNCDLLLVEANSASLTDLGTAVNEAVALGAKFIDNDYSIPESTVGPAETTYDTEYFDHPGVAITAPAGNAGYGAQYPADSQYVTAVGGTVLTADSSVARGYTEAPWPGSGAGCSEYEPKPNWQTDTGCTGRSENDVSAVASDVAYYDTPEENGWAVAYSTVVSSAIIAATYALAGPPAAGTYPASYPYKYPGGSYTTPGNAYPYVDGLNDITGGGTDGTCSPAYLCTAGAGYDGPTGLGTPNTVAAFSGTGSLTGQLRGWEDTCIDSQGGTAGANTAVVGNACDTSANQVWTQSGNGTVHVNSTTCLYIKGAATSSGSPVELATCEPGDGGEQWTPNPVSQLYNPRSGLCLYDPGTGTAGTQLEIASCSTSRAEVWPVANAGPAAVTGAVTSQHYPGYCMDDLHSSTAAGNTVDIYPCNGSSAQNITVEANGTLQVLGMCIATSDDGTAPGPTSSWRPATATRTRTGSPAPTAPSPPPSPRGESASMTLVARPPWLPRSSSTPAVAPTTASGCFPDLGPSGSSEARGRHQVTVAVVSVTTIGLVTWLSNCCRTKFSMSSSSPCLAGGVIICVLE